MKLLSGRWSLIFALSLVAASLVLLVNIQLKSNPRFDVAVLLPASDNQMQIDIYSAEEISKFPHQSEFAGILTRPLFSKDRKPWKPKAKPKKLPVNERAKIQSPVPTRAAKQKPQQQQKKPEVVPFQAKLIGVAMTQNDGIAMLKNENSSNLVKLVVGDTYKGWTVAMVNRSSITFTSNGNELKFDVLFREKR